jgi:hypothetical protein
VTRRALVGSALALQVAVVVAVAAGAPAPVRLVVGLAYACMVPGFATVGLLRLRDWATEVTLSIVVSLMLCTAAAQALIWSGRYSLAATLAVLGAVSVVGLAGQLRLAPAVDRADRTGLSGGSDWL